MGSSRQMITLATPFVGKDYCIGDYLKGLYNLDFDKKKIDLVFHDGSGSPGFKEILDRYIEKCGKEYASYTYVKDNRPPMHDISAGNVIKSARIASVYNRLKKYVKNEYLYVIEDDIVPPKTALTDLYAIMEKYEDAGMAVGRQMCRWGGEDGRLYALAWDYKKRTVFPLEDDCKEHQIENRPLSMKKNGLESVHGTGMGCNLIRNKLFQREEFRETDNGLIGFDLIFCKDIVEWGYRIIHNWGLHCRHYHIVGRGAFSENKVMIFE